MMVKPNSDHLDAAAEIGTRQTRNFQTGWLSQVGAITLQDTGPD